MRPSSIGAGVIANVLPEASKALCALVELEQLRPHRHHPCLIATLPCAEV
jgi:hypothetical protein